MIIFKKLKYRNFLSTGNNTVEIDLNKSSATLVFGTNGQGKSTLIDALTFGLFGKPYRNINIPTLVNSINDRDLLVEVEFSIGKTNYLIKRGLKPKIFEVYRNKVLIDQDSKNKDYQAQLEQNILKLNYRSFSQVVVLGSATFVPFMRLKAADRRFIIEDLLDIHIFSAMNVLLKQKVITLKDTLRELETDHELTGEKLDIQLKYLETLKADNRNKIEENQAIIATNQQKKLEIQSDISDIQKEIDALISEKKNIKNLQKKVHSFENVRDSINKNVTTTKEELEFYSTTENCPTCKQNINTEFKNELVESKNHRLHELQAGLVDLEKELETNKQSLEAAFEILYSIQEKEKEISQFQSEISSLDSYIKKIQDEIDALQSKKQSSADDEKRINELRKELKGIERKRKKLTEEKQYMDIVAMMLKDSGIKTKIIKQYLPLINKYVNKYLSDLDFFVNFNFDENFKEEIKSRGRDNFSYENFSEGEKLRIDLAILFAFREISRMKNQSNCNLLIMDEILDRSLDGVGIDDFLKIMNQLWKNMNIFIISPRGELFMDKFPATIRFVKQKQFSGVAND